MSEHAELVARLRLIRVAGTGELLNAAAAAIEALERERDAEKNRVAAADRDAQKAAEMFLVANHEAVRLMNRAEAAEVQVAALREALAEFGKHHAKCLVNLGDPRCDCGLDAALADTQAAAEAHDRARRIEGGEAVRVSDLSVVNNASVNKYAPDKWKLAGLHEFILGLDSPAAVVDARWPPKGGGR